MSAMSDMSRAVRQEMEKHGPTLRDIPTDALGEYVQIITAFSLDLREELNRRPDRPRRPELVALEQAASAVEGWEGSELADAAQLLARGVRTTLRLIEDQRFAHRTIGRTEVGRALTGEYPEGG